MVGVFGKASQVEPGGRKTTRRATGRHFRSSLSARSGPFGGVCCEARGRGQVLVLEGLDIVKLY
eukprot:14063756-Alexandrium_andersonii.AAC.1